MATRSNKLDLRLTAAAGRFRLDAKQWEQFMADLNAPPKPLPHLQRLLSEPGPFDQTGAD